MAFRGTTFVAGLSALAAATAAQAIKELVVKQRTPKQQSQDRAEYRAGIGG